MNEAQFEQLLADGVEALRQKNAALEAKHGIGRYARWDHDGERGVLTFSDPGQPTVLEAKTTDIGSYSLNTKTWLWAWANESNIEMEREKAGVLKELFEVTGMRIFRDAHFDCDEYVAWELAATSVQHLGSLGCYRGPVGHLWVFWSIDSLVRIERGT